MTSFRNKTVFLLLTAAILVASVGCTASSGKGKNPFSAFQNSGPKAQKPVEKTGPRTMDEIMSMKRDDRW